MNRFFQDERRICIIAAIALALPFFLRFPNIYAQNKKGHDKKDRVVVVISLDGFPAYALKDPRLPIPTLRRLASEGATAESMQPVNPTVTWPNHTAIVTGVDVAQHQVVFNGLLERPEKDGPPKIEPWRDKDVMVHAPTIFSHQSTHQRRGYPRRELPRPCLPRIRIRAPGNAHPRRPGWPPHMVSALRMKMS